MDKHIRNINSYIIFLLVLSYKKDRMLFSRTSEYAIRALGYLAIKDDKEVADASAISQGTGIPVAYVSKVCQALVRARILESKRGPKGGYTLHISPSKLTLLEIIESIDDLSKSSLTGCIMGLAECGEGNPCPLHHIWAKAKASMQEKLARKTLLDVVRVKGKPKARQRGRIRLSHQMRKVFGH